MSYGKGQFFRRIILENLLDNEGVEGLRFFTTRIILSPDTNSVCTLAAVTVLNLGIEGDGGKLSALPCPPDCAGGGYVDNFPTPTHFLN